jgi:GNAT superfamily N-acetyltransferase
MEFETQVRIHRLGPADLPAAVSLLARAFEQEPAKLSLLPDAGVHRAMLEMTMQARLYDTLRYGTVHGAWVDGELGAIAVWYPPGVTKLSGRGALQVGSIWLRGLPAVARGFPYIFRMLFSDLRGALQLVRGYGPGVARASRGIAWRLELLGTLPEHRRKGLARALLERQLQRCDQDAAAAWLETTDPVNPPFYERFHFETVVHLPGPRWLPGYWVMRREPREVLEDFLPLLTL